MLVLHSFYQYYDRNPIRSDIPLSEILPLESGVLVELDPTDDIQCEEVSMNYTQDHGFYNKS
jgi:hypothetical protein